MEITYGQAVAVARARYMKHVGTDGPLWVDLGSDLQHTYVTLSRRWTQAAADAGLLAPATVYRWEFAGFPYGATFTTCAAAQAQAEAHLRAHCNTRGITLGWVPVDSSPTARTELIMYGPEPGTEEMSGHVIHAAELRTDPGPNPQT